MVNKMARATVTQVNSDLKEHLAQCHEQSKTVFNQLQELKQDLRSLTQKVEVTIYSFTGFLATTLVAVLFGIFGQ
jgi:primosomal protein N''